MRNLAGLGIGRPIDICLIRVGGCLYGGGVVLQLGLTALIAAVVAILAFSAYGSFPAALVFGLLSAVLWTYLIRL